MSEEPAAAFYVMPRYHGTEDPFYRMTKAKLGTAAVQGRGRCERCGHQTIQSPEQALRMGGVTKWCAQCSLEFSGATLQDYARLALDLSHCPESPCPYRDFDQTC